MEAPLKTLLLSFLVTSAVLANDLAQLRVSEANSAFANNLYKALATNPNQDVFFSPLGIHLLLSVLYSGSASTTKEALASSLQIPDPALSDDGYQDIMSQLNSVKNITMHMANKIYLKDSYKLKQEFQDIVIKKFLAEIEPTNFEQTAEAAKKINQWVSDKTNGKIEKLIEANDLGASTRLVLLNALYVKGDWSSKFDKRQTTTKPFIVDNDIRTTVSMMHKMSTYKFKNDPKLDAKVLELPFSNKATSMFVVLPNDKNGISKLEKGIQEVGINALFSDLKDKIVVVTLPKFKLETKMDLTSPLKQMGLMDLFDGGKCSLPNIIESGESLFVSKVVQKAFIEVSEEGAEAGAASGAIVPTRAKPIFDPVETFNADHPFFIVLKHEDTVLFYGKIFKPTYHD